MCAALSSSLYIVLIWRTKLSLAHAKTFRALLLLHKQRALYSQYDTCMLLGPSNQLRALRATSLDPNLLGTQRAELNDKGQARQSTIPLVTVFMQRPDLPCMYLAHYEPKSIINALPSSIHAIIDITMQEVDLGSPV